MKDVYYLLSLLSVTGVGSQRIRNLISHFGCAEEVLKAGISDIGSVECIDKKTAHNVKEKVDWSFAEDQLSRIDKHEAQLLTYWDEQYPEMLKRIYDPPVLLYVQGSFSGKNMHNIAVVGTRSPSQEGRGVAERFGIDLAKLGITVVSGLARGIDTCAHRGALKGGGETYAVLGCGLDVIYPPENKKLYTQIAECGAIVTEFPMNTEPAGVHFPRRNRIISGLSLGTLVVEAGDRSGALITAYMALEQGREVFAIPGSTRNLKSRGPHRLIKEGAKLVESVDDILVELPQLGNRSPKKRDNKIVYASFSTGERKIWEVLTEKPIHIDRIAMDANCSTSEALAMLLSLELKDCVKQLSGMMFVRQPL